MFRTEKPWARHYEGHVSLETEVYEGSLADFLEDAVEEHRDKTALTFDGEEIAFVRLGELVERMAASLAASGVERGDRVALMLPNCPEYVISFFAVVRLGAIVTQINPMYVEREIEYILTDSGAETIVVHAEGYPQVKPILPETSLKNVVVVSLENEPPDLYDGHHEFDAFLFMDAAPTPEVTIDPLEDVAALQYTGGTTGVSKGAMLTHRNMVANAQQITAVLVEDPAEFADNQKIIAVLPFFHIYGLTCVMLVGIRLGLNQLLVPRFEPEVVLDLVRDEKPVLFSGVPTMYIALNASGADLIEHGFGEVRVFNSGGSAMPVDLLHAFEEETGREIHEGYGLSEASPVTHNNPIFAERRPGSIGIPVPSTDARIVDVESGETEMPVGESGEMVIQGPQVMKGYWNMPEETEASLKDGWLYTGDVACMDEDGYFYIVDRKKDMILAGGYNVYPRDIEEVLYEHKGISEAVAIGVPDEYRGETIKAFVVRAPNSEATEEELLTFCEKRLAPYKKPETIEFRDELPKSTVGKLLRRVLADEEKSRSRK